MNAHPAIRAAVLGAFLVALSGCATYPISKELRRQAKPVTLPQVAANPAAYTGATVIWGGTILDTVNSTNGGAIYVLEEPLNPRERPERRAPSRGRFIARSAGFIDPAVFRKGALVTVAGPIAGVQTQPLQGAQYAYPVVGIGEVRLWRLVRRVFAYPGWYWGWYGGPGWEWGWYGPGWYGPGPGWGWDWEWEWR